MAKININKTANLQIIICGFAVLVLGTRLTLQSVSRDIAVETS
jgi:hypothetical protein